MKRIIALSAGLSQPSSTRLLVDRMAAHTQQALADSTISTYELRDYAHDIVDNMLTGFASPRLEELKNAITAADGVIAATPVFSQSFSGLFKSFLDVIDIKSLHNKPVLLGATAGTARHSLALEYAIRPVFAYFKAAIVPTAVFAASDDWGSTSGPAQEIESRISQAAEEFVALIRGAVLTPTHKVDEFETPDFATLLKAVQPGN